MLAADAGAAADTAGRRKKAAPYSDSNRSTSAVKEPFVALAAYAAAVLLEHKNRLCHC